MESYSGTRQILSFIQEDWKLLVLLTAVFALYFYYTSTFDHFEKRGIPYMKPVIFVGNLGPRIKATTSFHEFQLKIYNHFKGNRFGGFFEGRRPVLYILDPDLIKAITIRDFDHFTDRNTLNSREPRYLSRSLLNLKGSEWKSVRSALTPAFSSSRLRSMLPLIQLCSHQMVDYFKQYENKEVEMKQAMGHFTLEVIGACAFGIRCDALTDRNAHFYQVAEKFDYMPKKKRLVIFFFLLFMPKMLRFFNISFLNKDSTDELVRILQLAKAERRSSNVKKNDFLQLLIDLADKEKMESANKQTECDEATSDAQALLFLIAGYETSSTLLSFALHQLVASPRLQVTLRQHVLQHHLHSGDGAGDMYDNLARMDYLEAFLMETLRMYPPVSRVDRVCTKPYALGGDGAGLRLRPGDVVGVPVYGLHHDPALFPEPQHFRPERFLRRDRPHQLFLAFGAGPRNCIGSRFAMIAAKMAMVALLSNFEFSACEKTVHPIRFDSRAVLLKAADGLWLRVQPLNKQPPSADPPPAELLLETAAI